MADDNLDYLLPRKEEIHEVSTWASVKLRFIRDDLAPFIGRGLPIKHLMRMLAPLEITNRRETVRRFVLDEFPEEYARYYAKRATANRIRRQTEKPKAEPTPASQSAPAAPKASESSTEKPTAARGTKRLEVDSMLGRIGDFTAGKQFENSDQGE